MITTADLKRQKLLADLQEGELATILKCTARENHAKGAVIFREGEATRGILLIHRGKVEISKTTPDGWKHTLAVLSEQAFFGELSVIEDRPNHSTTATALDTTELYRITAEDLHAFETSEPAMMFKIMKTIARTASRNVHSMNEKLMKALISY